MSFDPRNTLARPDLADVRLEGRVRAASFAATRPMRCALPSAGLRRAPDDASEQQDQLLFGEVFDVLEEALEGSGGWAWGQARRDGYVGWVRLDALGPAGEAPTHRIGALRTCGFSRPDLKSAPVALYSLNALITAGETQNGYVDAGAAGWIFAPHLAPIGAFETDPAAVAERFVGAPYLWGGRDSLGLDCSGLVQQAFYAIGRACPRDTDQQLAAFTRAVEREQLARGDLVFWKGHVGMMLGAERFIHANAHHMAVAIEPLDEAVDRISRAGVAFRGFRRP
jgi:cell wall-associated NlpC family hydrolase